jgi:hypothetical protein
MGLIALSVLYTACQKQQESIANSQPVKKMVLGNFELLSGSPFLLATVNTVQDERYQFSSSSSGSSSTYVHNYLFFNRTDLSAHRLVPKNDWLFLQHEKLGQYRNGDLIKVEGLWYAVVKEDTSSDKQLTELDRKTIAMSDVAGKSYTEVISQVDRILGTHRKGATTLQIFYSLNDKNFVTEINIQTRQVIRTRELPSIQ